MHLHVCFDILRDEKGHVNLCQLEELGRAVLGGLQTFRDMTLKVDSGVFLDTITLRQVGSAGDFRNVACVLH